MLTQETLKSLFHYDPDTGVFTNIKARPKVRVGSIAGTVNTQGYVQIMVNRKKYQAHRIAWLYVYGNFPPDELDHINRIRTDNRMCNLRPATSAENHQNRSMLRNNTSGFVGVGWHNATQKWRSHINLHNKQLHLGYFTDLTDAIAARKAAEPKYHPFNHPVAA